MLDIPISVTFDTNTFRQLVEPMKRKPENYQAYDKIRLAIETGKIQPYLCDVIVVIEGIPKKLRGEYLRNIGMITEISEPSRTKDHEGNPAISITVRVSPDYSHRPPLPPELVAAIETGKSLGFRFISVPRVAQPFAGILPYKHEDAEAVGERIERSFHALETIERNGVGSALLRSVSESVIANEPGLEHVGEMRAYAWSGDEKAIPKLAAEMADGDALAAHYGYAHDVFCTLDEGKSANHDSVFDPKSRQWLLDTLGITIMTPNQLADHLIAS